MKEKENNANETNEQQETSESFWKELKYDEEKTESER